MLLADLYYQKLALCGCKGPLSEKALMELFPKLQANISTGVSKVMLHCGFGRDHLVPHQRVLLWDFCWSSDDPGHRLVIARLLRVIRKITNPRVLPPKISIQ